jgi:hypothetical protein
LAHDAIADHRMTFALPATTNPGSLEIAMHEQQTIEIPWPDCSGAHCRMRQTPQFTQHLWK